MHTDGTRPGAPILKPPLLYFIGIRFIHFSPTHPSFRAPLRRHAGREGIGPEAAGGGREVAQAADATLHERRSRTEEGTCRPLHGGAERGFRPWLRWLRRVIRLGRPGHRACFRLGVTARGLRPCVPASRTWDPATVKVVRGPPAWHLLLPLDMLRIDLGRPCAGRLQGERVFQDQLALRH